MRPSLLAYLLALAAACTPTLPRGLQRAKEWTVLVYMAADNDLSFFVAKTLQQLEAIGSNQQVNFVVQLIGPGLRAPKCAHRYYIEQGKRIEVMTTPDKNSGSPETLTSFCTWAMAHYPARHYALIIWNHGTGALEVATAILGRAITDVFAAYAPRQGPLHALQAVPALLPLALETHQPRRGLCFDDSVHSHMTNRDLMHVLEHLYNGPLQQKKLDILGLDACMMAMIEVASLIKPYVHILVASQEVELGTGWNHTLAFNPFTQPKPPTAEQLAHAIVSAYQKAYHGITARYTQSALILDDFQTLENNVATIAHLLTLILRTDTSASCKNAITACRHPRFCTHFDEAGYIDLHHLYRNLARNVDTLIPSDLKHASRLRHHLATLLESGTQLIEQMVIANATGPGLKQARGIGIYFPRFILHESYATNSFAEQSGWHTFLTTYLATPATAAESSPSER